MSAFSIPEISLENLSNLAYQDISNAIIVSAANNSNLPDSTYVSVATALSNSYLSVVGTNQYLFDAVYQIVQLGQIGPADALLDVFWSTYEINMTKVTPDFIKAAIRKINANIIASGYADIDTYLEDTDQKVPTIWVYLSTLVGYPISNANAE